jgi:hypothetical protein
MSRQLAAVSDWIAILCEVREWAATHKWCVFTVCPISAATGLAGTSHTLQTTAHTSSHLETLLSIPPPPVISRNETSATQKLPIDLFCVSLRGHHA